MNTDLKKYYEDVYSKDKNTHFLKYRDGKKLSESHIWSQDWINKNISTKDAVLDFGCGEGDFLDFVKGFSKSIGLDYSEQALATARKKFPQIDFIYGDQNQLSQFKNKMDLAVSFGTLEHVDDPYLIFDALASVLKDTNSHLIVSSPSFLNPRGIVWMTLVKLFDVPMSLSDKHFLSIADYKKFAEKNGTVKLIEQSSSDYAVSYDDYFFHDMKKRLTNALRDAKMDNSKVNDLLLWFEDVMPYLAQNQFSGVEATYIFKKIK